MKADDIKKTVKSYILEEFLPGESPDALGETTELISQGVIDSLATLKLVAYLEERFGITLAPHEADVEHLNTLNDITALVARKLS
jgi:acyl carrier protein